MAAKTFNSNLIFIGLLLSSIFWTSCNAQPSAKATQKQVSPGAYQTQEYFPKLVGKNVGIVANQTSVIGEKHLVDSLLAAGINVVKIYAPEHGFRGKADAGEKVLDGIDSKTGLPLISIYGKNKKPSAEQLDGLDVVVFDIQDVGARFYTYLSTMHYVMEACAENGLPVVVLDRPNPMGHLVDGPLLDSNFKSFVGMHPIPVSHGCTLGELALMINKKGWLKNRIKCDLTIIPIQNWTHQTPYSLPIKPSPNVPTDATIRLYTSICFFEGTVVSVGRGTDKPFELIGSPFTDSAQINKLSGYVEFTPQPNEGAKYPLHKDTKCFGFDLNEVGNQFVSLDGINPDYLIKMYEWHSSDENFFRYPEFFDKLAGTDKLRKQILAGLTAKEIKDTWQADINRFKEIRKQYLLYPEN